MTDDLNYKIEFQAQLNQGNTLAQLNALQDAVDHLIQTGQIQAKTWEEIDTVLEQSIARLSDYSVAVTDLGVDEKALAAFVKNSAAALREKNAEQAKSAAMAKEAAAADKAAAKEIETAEKQKADAIRATALEQQRLDDQFTRASTLASRTNYAASKAGGAALSTAITRLPAAIASPSSNAEVAYNRELLALQDKLIAAEDKYTATVHNTTTAFKSQLAAIQEENGVVSGAKMAELQSQLAIAVDRATGAYKGQVAQIQEAGKALQQNAKVARETTAATMNNMGTSSRGGGGASFAALYLQEQFYQRVGKAAAGLAVESIKTSAQYEQSFANVARTTDLHGKDAAGGIEAIRQGLMKLDTQIPMTFDELSKIAAAGNEAGVSAGAILSFTKTVAEYSTVTGTSIDSTTQAFGGLNAILHLNNSEYANLGSAISYVGRMSVASEPEIVAMLNKMASTATQAGMTKQEVVGLAGAMASLKEAPERAQSALQNYNKVLNTALAGGTAHGGIKEWAKVLGMSPEDASQLAQTNATAFMTKFLEKLNSTGSVGKTQIFGDLGLNNARVTEVFSRLSGSIPLVKKLIDDANKSWAKGTDLQNQYAKATDTLMAHFNELKNSVSNLLADLGKSGLQGELKGVVDILLVVVKAIDTFAKQNPKIVTLAMTFGALVGAFLLVRAAMLAVEVTAKAFTFFDAANAVEINGFGSALKALGVQFGILSVKAVPAVTAMEGVGAAAVASGEEVATGAKIAGTGVAVGLDIASAGTLIVFTILAALAAWVMTNWPQALKIAAGAVGWLSDALIFVEKPINFVASLVQGLGAVVAKVAEGIVEAASLMAQAFGDMASVTTLNGIRDGLDQASGSMGKFATNTDYSMGKLDDGRKQIHGAADAMSKYADQLAKADKASQGAAPNTDALKKELADLQKKADDAAKAAGGAAPSLDKLGNSAGGAAEKVYTLADYANDLSSTMSRAFDIQFGPTQANDAIISTFDQMKQNALQAAQAVNTTRDSIAKLRAEMAATQADKMKQEYFLGVASQFGDTLRMGQIQGQIGTDNAALGSDNTQMTADKAQLAADEDKATKSLAGNTAGAAANREALIQLAQKYQDYIAKLAASGMNQKELTAKTEEAKKEFIKQATQLGYNKSAVDKVASAFDNMKRVIAGVPRNITVGVSTNAAITALNEFAAKAKSTASSVKGSLGGISVPTTPTTPSYGDRELAIRAAIRDLSSVHYNNVGQNMEVVAELDRYRSILKSGNFATGGYTGPGGKYEPAGVVHRGEYVVPSQYVNQSTGLPNADALGRIVAGIQPSGNGYASGGFVSGGGMSVVELGPKSLAAVRDVARQEAVAVISANGLASAVNSNNRNTRRRGGG